MGAAEAKALGSPHIHAWIRAVEWGLDVAEATKDDGAKTILKAYLTATKALPLADKVAKLGKEVRWFRCKDAWNSSIAKLLINVRPETDSERVWNVLDGFLALYLEGVAKRGLAPRNNLARKVQKELDLLHRRRGR